MIFIHIFVLIVIMLNVVFFFASVLLSINAVIPVIYDDLAPVTLTPGNPRTLVINL